MDGSRFLRDKDAGLSQQPSAQAYILLQHFVRTLQSLSMIEEYCHGIIYPIRGAFAAVHRPK
jgi:hypothetical protein